MSLSPTTIGDDAPLGQSTRHFKFLSGPNSTGGFSCSAIAEPFGPRNCGHASSGLFSARAFVEITQIRIGIDSNSLVDEPISSPRLCRGFRRPNDLRAWTYEPPAEPGAAEVNFGADFVNCLILLFSRRNLLRTVIVTSRGQWSSRRSFRGCGDSRGLV